MNVKLGSKDWKLVAMLLANFRIPPDPIPKSFCVRLVSISLCLVLGVPVSAQDWREKIGFVRLKAEIGEKLEDGTGVQVSVVEPGGGPDPANPQFEGKKFINELPPGQSISGHANTVGELLFGKNTSIAPGVNRITVFDATDFVTARSEFGTRKNPRANAFMVQNHSYIGDGEAVPSANEMLARLDYLIARDNVTCLVGMNNGDTTTLPQILGQSYNGLSVGRSDGAHSHGKTTLGGEGRIKPEIVAPGGTTSEATPMVSSVAALLHHKAINMRAQDAQRPETMKAILMAGASKSKLTNWHQGQGANGITRIPIDEIYGAGEVNVHASYQILSGGEFEGSNTNAIGAKAPIRGWDFGESCVPGKPLYWTIEIRKEDLTKRAGDAESSPPFLSILLTWNARYTDAQKNFTKDRVLPNMQLRLWDSNAKFKGKQLSASDSPNDNVEHIYRTGLEPGLYTFGVATDSPTEFGLAWQFSP